MSSPMIILQRARWHLAALSVRTALARTRLALLQAYDPNQPRVPAGSREGGRWADGDPSLDPGFMPDDAELVRIAEDGDRRYTVVLSEDEGRGGGHTLRDHVGKTDAELMGGSRRVEDEHCSMCSDASVTAPSPLPKLPTIW